MMRKTFLIALFALGVLLPACGVQFDPEVTPATDKLTFLFFFTDG
ncbi:MAG TPA: hypothetical protein VMN57_12735 [Anaerolineales bacterium]|nr:hypothetical protein [Anaerolineales bacterium]